ncbi:hypothetical protein BDQ17DRAFT_1209615, partial [Cyathus striatus]
CSSATFYWELGLPYHTYPYVLHDISNKHPPVYDIIKIDAIGSVLSIWSHYCLRVSNNGSACISCKNMVNTLKKIMDHAGWHSFGLQCSTLSHLQLCQKLDNTGKLCEQERFQAIHKATWKKLLVIVGTQDVPALHQIFRNANSFRWSIEKTLEMTQKAIAGLYHAQNFSELEIDLANVIYDL